ncbi:MAG: SAM-dependent methyltransferase, partial [Prevotella sp.]|nr:SAM-dependent methyltransferase [Prevotella sp.]
MRRNLFNQYLSASDFRGLFVSEMFWNNPSGATLLPEYTIDECTFQIEQIAERSGFQILQCKVDEIPASSVCKKLDTKLRKNAENYICIFVVPDTMHHLWVAPVKKVEKRDVVLVEYDSLDKAGFLFEKMESLSFALDDAPTIIDIIEKVQAAFLINSEKITKDFYTGFKKEHTNFAKFITGIDDHLPDKDNKNKQWYTSVMLNRLMFCYFIQKKEFLDGDADYLRHKLEWTQQHEGEDRFFNHFYKGFLVNLFHDGLNAPQHKPEFEAIYGRIPYLNGGMFDEHQIEQDYTGLDIADEAFSSLFDFFDKWHWHLDDRMTASGRDINPDVLGYIFEQYINDRAQMGAYYTKEDITEYIGRNTILPYLMDAVRRKDEKLFRADSHLWQFLRESSDRYIFDAMKKGNDQSIPEEIAIGLDTTKPNLLERRTRWNERTPEPLALPTEIWRETIERLKRYHNIKAKIENGEITEINDFITYNLDIRQFVADYLAHTQNHLFVEYFYDALQHVTILDPTCGSGAFLFAALNILEPLYETCINRMQEFNEQNPHLFNRQLQEIAHKYRSNIQYFIYKSIILRNLYGVDIMVEATEIAKLRLFLKMVAVVEVDKRDRNLGLDPLPDIDFNIRCGNTLVGYATQKELERDLVQGDMFAITEFKEKVNDEMDKVARTYDIFKDVQLKQTEDMAAFKRAKHELKVRLTALNDLLNH